MSYIFGFLLGFIAVSLYVALRRQRTCGKRQWEMMYTCVRVSVRPCYEHIVHAEDVEDGQEWKQRWSVVWSEHVWATDEYLETGRSPYRPRRMRRRVDVAAVGHPGTGPHPHNWPEMWRDDGKCLWKSCGVYRTASESFVQLAMSQVGNPYTYGG